VQSDNRRRSRPSGRARRLISFAVLTTATTWSLSIAVAWADTPPSNSGLPSISGVAQQGEQLTADPGTWSGDSPITFTYQWSDGQTGSPVTLPDGQTGNMITLSGADLGQSITVTVTASNDFGQITATSEPVGPVLPAAPAAPAAQDPRPALSGTAQQGDTLSVTNGTWDNSPTAYGYEWEDCNSTGTLHGNRGRYVE